MTTSNSADALPSSTGLSPSTTPITQTDLAISTEPMSHILPDEPLVVIQPGGFWVSFKLRELWSYRDLLYFLMWRDVKVRYKQTLLGVLWVVLQPLFMMLIFTIFFGRLAGIKSDGLPYSLFAYAGLLPWMFFAAAANTSGNSMVNNAALLTKVYFPRLMVPAAPVGAALVDFGISFVVLAALMIYWGVVPTWNLLMLPVLVLLLVTLTLGFGVLMSALNVKYRDIRLALPFLIQVWFFATPIIYPVSIVPERWRWVMSLNPMTGIVEGFRAALYGQNEFDWLALAISAISTLALFVYAAFTFQRMEKSFADIV